MPGTTYATDASIWICPHSNEVKKLRKIAKSNPKELIDDQSYIYLGYLITSDAEMKAFAQAYKERIAQGLPFDVDLPVAPGAGPGGGDVIPRLREGCERLLTSETGNPAELARLKGTIPVMWDRCTFTEAGGVSATHRTGKQDKYTPQGNVLFMDGHVEFLGDGTKWPMTSETARILTELDKP